MIKLFDNMFSDSFYQHSVIGSEEDINKIKLNDAVDFHSRYYSPQNSVISLCGDLDFIDAEKSIRHYFSDIPNKNISVCENLILKGKNSFSSEIVYDNVALPALYLGFIIPELGTESEFTLDFFANFLAANKSSRLYKNLVYDKKILQSISAVKYQMKYAGVFIVVAHAYNETNLEDVQNEIIKEIHNLRYNGFSDNEFDAVRNSIEFENLQNYYNLGSVASNFINGWLYFKDYLNFFNAYERYLSVKRENVYDSIEKYFINKNYFCMHYLPKNSL
jgi:zinc protease